MLSSDRSLLIREGGKAHCADHIRAIPTHLDEVREPHPHRLQSLNGFAYVTAPSSAEGNVSFSGQEVHMRSTLVLDHHPAPIGSRVCYGQMCFLHLPVKAGGLGQSCS